MNRQSFRRFYLGWIICLVSCSAFAALPPVDQKTVCLECHDEMIQILALPNVHAPFDEGECSACHNPHAARHARLLSDRESAVCTRCHDDAADWLMQQTVHRPVAEGKCVACHDPHASTEGKLLKSEYKELCSTCHAEIKRWETRATLHDPVKRGQCNRCHPAHASTGEQLLTSNQADVCLECHSPTPTFIRKHKGFDPRTSKCSACHDPHSSDDPSLLMKEIHVPFAEGNCDVCHVSQQAGAGYPLRGNTLHICGECHGDIAGTIQRFTPHGASEAAACEICHNPHTSHETNLLKTSQKQLCLGCHDPGRGVKSPGENPHAERACTSCHAVHGNDEPFYLKKEPMKLCSGCHIDQHHVSHPMGDQTTDPLTGGIVTCTSCHKLHGWQHEALLLADAKRDLCIRCHRTK